MQGDTAIGIDARFQQCRQDFGENNPSVDAYNLEPGTKLTLGRTSNAPYDDTCA